MPVTWWQLWAEIRTDLLSLLVSTAMILSYHLYMAYRVRHNPGYTLRSLMATARSAWTRSIMSTGKDILAVQTLRNSTMAAIFLASTSILLIIGVLTLSGQADKLGSTWNVLNPSGTAMAEVWQFKIVLLLIDLLSAFFFFSLSIRYFNHVGYMINVPLAMGYRTISVEMVTTQLNRAGAFYGYGMRAYYYVVPLLLWLFGPHLMMGATAALVAVMFRFDYVPPPSPAEIAALDPSANKLKVL
jgi:uncharacterized membrane protein